MLELRVEAVPVGQGGIAATTSTSGGTCSASIPSPDDGGLLLGIDRCEFDPLPEARSVPVEPGTRRREEPRHLPRLLRCWRWSFMLWMRTPSSPLPRSMLFSISYVTLIPFRGVGADQDGRDARPFEPGIDQAADGGGAAPLRLLPERCVGPSSRGAASNCPAFRAIEARQTSPCNGGLKKIRLPAMTDLRQQLGGEVGDRPRTT